MYKLDFFTFFHPMINLLAQYSVSCSPSTESHSSYLLPMLVATQILSPHNLISHFIQLLPGIYTNLSPPKISARFLLLDSQHLCLSPCHQSFFIPSCKVGTLTTLLSTLNTCAANPVLSDIAVPLNHLMYSKPPSNMTHF